MMSDSFDFIKYIDGWEKQTEETIQIIRQIINEYDNPYLLK